MSLITQQTLLQTKSDLNDLQRRISVGEDTPKLRSLVNGMKKKIEQLEKQLQGEKAVVPKVAKGPAGPPRGRYEDNKPKKALPPLPADMDLTCCDCTNCFVFSGKDQVFFKKMTWKDPSRCPDCREARKNKKPAGKSITCGDCGTEFFFSEGKQKQFAEKKWDEPKWCQPCKVSRKAKWAAEQAAKATADAEAKPENEDLGPRPGPAVPVETA